MPEAISNSLAKEQFSLAFIRAIATVAGFAASKPEVDDDSIDLVVAGRGVYGSLKSPRLELQVKCTGSPTLDSTDLIFGGLSMKNYDDLRGQTLVPRLLVVATVPDHVPENWIRHTAVELALLSTARWVSLHGRPEILGQDSTTIRLPLEQHLNVESLRILMETGGRV